MKPNTFFSTSRPSVAASAVIGIAILAGFVFHGWSAETVATNSFDVRAFGAVGDGQAKDTTAFQKALDACAAAGGGTVQVPQGVYLIGSIVVGSNTTIQLTGRSSLLGSPDVADYPLVRVRWEGEFAQGHRALIAADKASHIAIKGRGFIYGPPITLSKLRNPRGPALIEPSECDDVVLEDFTTQYQQLWSIHPVLCRDLVARNLTIRSVSFNGDGMDVDSCSNVLIDHCSVDTGDDAVVLKSGRGMEAVRLGRPTENVVITNCTLHSSLFAGFAVGSELSGGIRNVRLVNCVISGRQNGISLKSREGRGAFIENLTGENLTIDRSPTFLAIELLKKGIQASEPVTGDPEKWTRLRNINFTNVLVNDVGHLVLAREVSPQCPVDGLRLENIFGKCDQGMVLANMTNVVLHQVAVVSREMPFLSTTNVQGEGLEVR